jgi:hypothetical protein
MTSTAPSWSAGVVTRLTVTVCLSIGLAAAAPAQQPSRPTGPPPGTANAKRDATMRREREAQLRNIDVYDRVTTDKRRAEAAGKAISEDFRDIQVLRNDLARHLVAGGPIDFNMVAGKAEEIHKRAGRLKTNLVPIRPTEAAARPASVRQVDARRMTGALVTLCKVIDRFTASPIFETTEVFNVQETAKAGNDLELILELSETIRTSAQALEKTASR